MSACAVFENACEGSEPGITWRGSEFDIGVRERKDDLVEMRDQSAECAAKFI